MCTNQHSKKIARLRLAAIAIWMQNILCMYSMHCILCIVFFAFIICNSCICFIHYLLCIVFYALFSMHYIICIVLYALHSLHCLLCIIFYASYAMHLLSAMYSIHCIICNYAIIKVSVLLETRWHGRNYRQTDIATYRAAIAAKN